MQLKGDVWVVLYSKEQGAYHVELRSEWDQRGKMGLDWKVVASASSWNDAMRMVDERQKRGVNK